MSSRPLRFVQAGDFLLHQPLAGLVDVPEHLAGRLMEAPYRATAGVFDAALNAQVDFVLLTGNLCDPLQSGPRGLVFLSKQFARLAERGIAVYWATGAGDRSRDWPANLKWPASVHIFAANRVEHLTHYRDGDPVCQIAGCSIDDPSTAACLPLAAFVPNSNGPFSIAVSPEPLSFGAAKPAAIGNHYWAHGESPQPAKLMGELDPPCVIHCAGTPQGRAPRQNGPHGCTLIEVENGPNLSDQNQIRLTQIATDAVRWHEQCIDLSEPIERAELERRLHEQMQTVIVADRVSLIRWHIDGFRSAESDLNSSTPSADGDLKSSTVAAELLAMLRSEYGFRDPPVWSVSLTIAPPELPASWREQQTLLGEFLRRINDFESTAAESLELDCFLAQSQLEGRLVERLSLGDSASRAKILRQAAVLGAELLSSSSLLRQQGASVR